MMALYRANDVELLLHDIIHTYIVDGYSSIQGSHRPISFIRIKHRTRANDNLCKYLMYHAACKVEFQPFTRSYSQLTFFNHTHGSTHS